MTWSCWLGEGLEVGMIGTADQKRDGRLGYLGATRREQDYDDWELLIGKRGWDGRELLIENGAGKLSELEKEC